jgi:hypothetical protein
MKNVSIHRMVLADDLWISAHLAFETFEIGSGREITRRMERFSNHARRFLTHLAPKGLVELDVRHGHCSTSSAAEGKATEGKPHDKRP